MEKSFLEKRKADIQYNLDVINEKIAEIDNKIYSWFSGSDCIIKKVEKDKVTAIIDAARLSSCAMNKQVLRYAAVSEKNMLKRIFDGTLWAAMVRPHRTPEWGKTAPDWFIVIHGPQESEASYVKFDVGAAVMSMEFKAEELGLDDGLDSVVGYTTKLTRGDVAVILYNHKVDVINAANNSTSDEVKEAIIAEYLEKQKKEEAEDKND